jgi:hypothetical protein
MHTFIHRSGWLVAGVLALFVVASMAGVVSGGPLDPTGAPAPTSGVLSPGTPITSVPFTASSSGYYYLTGNLTTAGSGAIGIAIGANDVTIDMRGFTLTSPDLTGTGIFASTARTGISVEHGQFGGFAFAVDLEASAGFVTDVHVRNFSATGVGIQIGPSSLIDGCTVIATAGHSAGTGILVSHASVVRNCVVSELNADGVDLQGDNTILESSQITGDARIANSYGVKITGLNATVRNSTLENSLGADIGVAVNAALIVDNTVHCAPWIVNLGTFSYYAPTGTEAHANMPRYAPGFC